MKIRVTGIVIQKDTILLLEQNVDNKRNWSLPGGGLEEGETLEEGLKRELQEETGIGVEVKHLLYLCDYIRGGSHVVHITFLCSTSHSELGKTTPGLDKNEIKSAKFVPISDLETHGFSATFKRLVQDGFPHKGSYMGDKSRIGL